MDIILRMHFYSFQLSGYNSWPLLLYNFQLLEFNFVISPILTGLPVFSHYAADVRIPTKTQNIDVGRVLGEELADFTQFDQKLMRSVEC